ncbi:MAG: helix-turn-helix transcriptional regulator [Thomasclavelia spiroformis]|uniref:helix-turn-helix transcriptional regulator n=1 Tax=Thomasclavelia spiroformis TaxID=29348 RepID=UPI0039905500
MQESRLFKIIYYLIDRGKTTAPELAEKFEVSVRTIYRDIDIISSVGVPIYATQGKGGGIAILDGYTLDKSIFSNKEKEQILNSLQSFIVTKGENTDDLLRKLGALFHMQPTNWIEIDFSDWVHKTHAQNVFHDIKKAILDRYIISFEYFNNQGDKVVRHVQPFKLVFKSKSWYLYGFCILRTDYRFFKLTRIKNLKITEKKFLPRKIENIIDAKIQVEEVIRVTLKFDKRVAFRVYDEFSDKVVVENSGLLIVKTDLPNSNSLFSYLFTFGKYVEIIDPPNLRQAMRQEIEEMYKIYLT